MSRPKALTHPPSDDLPDGVVHISRPLDIIARRVGLPGDALVSPRVATDLCGVPTALVLDLIESRAVRSVTIRGERVICVFEVERAIQGEAHHGAR
jgi:hypothetical protein